MAERTEENLNQEFPTQEQVDKDISPSEEIEAEDTTKELKEHKNSSMLDHKDGCIHLHHFSGRLRALFEQIFGNMAAGLLNTYLKGKGADLSPIYEKLALRDTGTKINSSERDTAGDQVITGVGFQPSCIIFVSHDATTANQNWSIGFGNLINTNKCIINYDNNTNIGIVNDVIQIRRAPLNRIQADLTALSADGFTLNWTLVGACHAYFAYICLP